MASTSSSTQPVWHHPQPTHATPTLRVYNSLTRSKVEFVTRTPGVVTWYNCGPTVYDASHMGHARNYLTQDIMRRILRDYFGYEVHFVMNVTDVDDKIIVRARQSHLFTAYAKEVRSGQRSREQARADVLAAWQDFVSKHFRSTNLAGEGDAESLWTGLVENSQNATWLQDQKAQNEKWSMLFDTAAAGKRALDAAHKDVDFDLTQLLDQNRDPLSGWLDARGGSQVTDPSIFRDLAAFWEASFFRSMSALRVEEPTVVTRVSEYIPEIVTFVEKIIQRGFAYEGGGSIWFDTTKFDGAAEVDDPAVKHFYAKLQPWSKGNRELLEEGEGSLTATGGKRSASDFALWKASKPGEPRWPAPWGPGRPGWHIECSVMASAILGDGMDVHSGGVDLAFPHHDNEIAQSEAYHGCRQWVNYFLHTGHLHIQGLKMSKSLKNFITIEEALSTYSARQLRLAFLSQTWNAKLDFKDSLISEVKAFETSVNNFFDNVAAFAREAGAQGGSQSHASHNYNDAEQNVLSKLASAQRDFREALCDSFDTPSALRIILDTINATNIYMSRGRKALNIPVILAVEDWINRMLRMFGLGLGSSEGADGRRVIGWGKASDGVSKGAVNESELLMPYLRALSTFRDEVRKLAISQAPSVDILRLSDRLRDLDLVDLGVALDDQEDGQALIKLVSPDELRKQRAAKLAEADEKSRRKAAAAAAQEAKRRERLEKGRASPSDLFKGDKQYGSFDEFGVPLTDAQGEVLPKSRRKKLQKEWDAQNKLHQEYLAAQQEGS